MKWLKRCLSISAVIALLCAISISGYDIQLPSDTSLYTTHDHTSFEQMRASGLMQQWDVVSVLGCFNNKDQPYFLVATDNKILGYVYAVKFKAIKTWALTEGKTRLFFDNPLASLRCLFAVPELSSL